MTLRTDMHSIATVDTLSFDEQLSQMALRNAQLRRTPAQQEAANQRLADELGEFSHDAADMPGYRFVGSVLPLEPLVVFKGLPGRGSFEVVEIFWEHGVTFSVALCVAQERWYPVQSLEAWPPIIRKMRPGQGWALVFGNQYEAEQYRDALTQGLRHPGHWGLGGIER